MHWPGDTLNFFYFFLLREPFPIFYELSIKIYLDKCSNFASKAAKGYPVQQKRKKKEKFCEHNNKELKSGKISNFCQSLNFLTFSMLKTHNCICYSCSPTV